MPLPSVSPGWKRFLRQQQLYIAIAVAIYAMFWAIGVEASMSIVLIYTLFLSNLTMFVQDRLSFLYCQKSLLLAWTIYLLVLCAFTPIAVGLAIVMVYYLKGAHGSLLDQLRDGWKFPAVATLVVGIVTELYQSTKDRLERRNVDLERAIETETAQREVQEQELERAREIQMNLLPKDIPQVAGFEIAGIWEPARTVGGDYFDVIRLSDTKVAICIADVVGKSVSAAFLMANVQATVRAFASESSSPAWLCGRVNSVLCSNIATGKFVTLFYGVLDAARGTLQYTNAGHLSPIRVTAAGHVQQLSSNGALLGVFPQWKFEEASLDLTAGDRLVLFTDGITEAMKPDGEEFGEERLVHLTRALAAEAPLALQNQLLSDVKKFCDSQLHDDATLVVVGAMVGHGAVAGHA